ncbi:hypothetical protein Scep_004832 [Stephania cephalantha]|uniref:Uncharacterized protein n=1 Tax=Stephania cephalantha TaxID=152367 RepID=A0AAP0PVS4_9MAGN
MARIRGEVSTSAAGSSGNAEGASISNGPSRLFKSRKLLDKEAKEKYESDLPKRGFVEERELTWVKIR